MLKIKSPNFIFGSFFCSLKNAILKKQPTFTAYICKLTVLFSYFCLQKRYFTNVEIYQIDPSMKKKGHILYITINYDEDENAFNNIFLLYLKKRTRSVTVKKLLSLSRIERTIYVLSTSVGILNTSEAIMRNVGGITLLEIF
jgi:ribosomal protein S8